MLLWLGTYICNWLAGYLSIYLSVCLSVRPSVCPSVRPSVCLSVYPSVCLVVGFRPRFHSGHVASSEVSCLERQTTLWNIRSDKWPPGNVQSRFRRPLNFSASVTHAHCILGSSRKTHIDMLNVYVESKMPVYRNGFENEICCKGDQVNFQYMPDQMRLPFLDAVKQYFTTIYLFISILCIILCIRLLCF